VDWLVQLWTSRGSPQLAEHGLSQQAFQLFGLRSTVLAAGVLAGQATNQVTAQGLVEAVALWLGRVSLPTLLNPLCL
jgi:hypothetical protein